VSKRRKKETLNETQNHENDDQEDDHCGVLVVPSITLVQVLSVTEEQTAPTQDPLEIMLASAA